MEEGLALVPSDVVLKKSAELLQVSSPPPPPCFYWFFSVWSGMACLFLCARARACVCCFLPCSPSVGFSYSNVQDYAPGNDVMECYNEILEDLREEFGNSSVSQYETQIIVSQKKTKKAASPPSFSSSFLLSSEQSTNSCFVLMCAYIGIGTWVLDARL